VLFFFNFEIFLIFTRLLNGSNKKRVFIVCDMLRKEILKKKQEALKKKSRRNSVGASNSLCFELRN